MAQQCTPAVLAAVNYHQIYFTFLLSIVWVASDACASPVVNALVGIPQYSTRQQADKQLTLLNELINNVNEDALFNELVSITKGEIYNIFMISSKFFM